MLRCVRCRGLMVGDENRSIDNDVHQVDGMRCVNCGYFCPNMPPSESMTSPRRLSSPAMRVMTRVRGPNVSHRG